MGGLPSIYHFFATRLINSRIQETDVRFYLSYDHKTTFKLLFFFLRNAKILPYIRNVITGVIT